MTARRLPTLALVSLFLVACGGGGGGGGGDPSTPNLPPVVTGLIHTTPEDLDLSTTLIASDPEGAAVTFTRTTEPNHGDVTRFQANGPLPGRFAGIISIAPDESSVVASSFANGAWTLERVDIAQLGAVIPSPRSNPCLQARV